MLRNDTPDKFAYFLEELSDESLLGRDGCKISCCLQKMDEGEESGEAEDDGLRDFVSASDSRDATGNNGVRGLTAMLFNSTEYVQASEPQQYQILDSAFDSPSCWMHVHQLLSVLESSPLYFSEPPRLKRHHR